MTKPGLSSFTFLTRQHLLLCRLLGQETMNDNGDPHPQPVFELVEISVESQAGVLLHLPRLYPGVRINYLTIRSDPAPSWSRPEIDVPFTISETNRIFVGTFWITAGGHQSWSIFVPLTHILPYIDKGGREFAWDEWGPTGTLIDVTSVSPTWCAFPSLHLSHSEHTAGLLRVCYVYGSNVVAYSYIREQDAVGDIIQGFIDVYQFNQPAIHRDARAGLSLDYEIFKDGMELGASEVFAEPVRTSLPFRFSRRLHRKWELGVPFPMTHPMITEDAIVLVNVCLPDDALRRAVFMLSI
jgi:hypothetical protein